MENECSVPLPDGHTQHVELPILNLTGRWRFLKRRSEQPAGVSAFSLFEISYVLF